MNITVPFFFGIMKVGVAHTELLHLRRIPILHNLSSSFLRISSWIFATGKGLWCLGTAPSFKSRCTGFVWNSPKVPSNKPSNCSSKLRISSCLSLDKWQQCFFTTSTKLAFSYDICGNLLYLWGIGSFWIGMCEKSVQRTCIPTNSCLPKIWKTFLILLCLL